MYGPFKISASSEHGWNDPPPLPYKTLQSSSGQKRNHLNKRPCYPADSVQVPAHHPNPLCPPPVGLSVLPSAAGRNTKASDVANTGASTEAEVSGSGEDSTISCSQLMNSLEGLLQDLVTSGAIEVCESRASSRIFAEEMGRAPATNHPPISRVEEQVV